jgi:hypothetical protein
MQSHNLRRPLSSVAAVETTNPSAPAAMSLTDDGASKAAAKEVKEHDAKATKAKLALAATCGSSAGSFYLNPLHAQAAGLHSIKGHISVELALDTDRRASPVAHLLPRRRAKVRPH